MPSDVVDFRMARLSANLISLQETRHQESFKSASSLILRITKKAADPVIVKQEATTMKRVRASGNSSKAEEKKEEINYG